MNSLEGVCGDVRTPDKLIDQVNDTSDGRHMWLAPILPGLVSSWGAFVSLVSGTCLSSRAGYPTHQNACGLSGRRRSSLTRLDGPSLGPREKGLQGTPETPCGRRPSVITGSPVPWPHPLALPLLEVTRHWTPSWPCLWPISSSGDSVSQISDPPAATCPLGA